MACSVPFVRRQRARRRERRHQELQVHLRGHDRDALGGDGRQAARVIDVVVRDDAEANRLVREDPPGFGDDRLRARLVLRSGLEEER
jgi:hypothetical protein